MGFTVTSGLGVSSPGVMPTSARARGLPRFTRERSGGRGCPQDVPLPQNFTLHSGPDKTLLDLEVGGGATTQPPRAVTAEPRWLLRDL